MVSNGSERVPVTASVLHDLRTPLGQIIGYSEILIELAEDDGLDIFVQDLNKIRSSGRQLLDKIEGSFCTVAGDDVRGRTPPQQFRSEGASTSNRFDLPSKSIEKIATSDAPLAGMILVVDDGQQNRDVLYKRLTRQGHEVAAVESGKEALEVIRSKSFDLVLLDIMMPEMDGFEVLQQLKTDAALCDIPVVMISALSAVDNIARCIELGADDYLSKPFNPTLLKARVISCLEKKRSRDREKLLFDQLQQNFLHLQELEKQRNDLTNMIVHDLRTPLTSIIGGLKSLSLVGDLNSDQQEMVDLSTSGGETLLGMINDLMDVEKLAFGGMQLERVDVSIPDIIASAVTQISSLAEAKHLSIAYDFAGSIPIVSADPNKLRRVVVNLLGNAIKFTSENGRITVAAKPASDRAAVNVSVADTGEGIPTEALSTIFEKFTQVPTRLGGRTMSTGLGLTFCKLTVEAHGGHINARSEMGNGSVFTFTLPCGG